MFVAVNGLCVGLGLRHCGEESHVHPRIGVVKSQGVEKGSRESDGSLPSIRNRAAAAREPWG